MVEDVDEVRGRRLLNRMGAAVSGHRQGILNRPRVLMVIWVIWYLRRA